VLIVLLINAYTVTLPKNNATVTQGRVIYPCY